MFQNKYDIDNKRLHSLEELEKDGRIQMGRGNVISKQDMQQCPGDYPVYSSAANNNGLIGTYGNYMFDDERLTWSIDGGGRWFYRNGEKYSVTNVGGWLKVLDPNINTRYLYHALSSQWVKKEYDYIHKALPSIIKDDYIVPVPPLAVQEEIVRILDKFTELEAELEKELEARKKQYEFYREELLALPDAPRLSLSKLTLNVNSINWKHCDGTKKYIDLSSVDRDTHAIIDADILEVSAETAPSRAKQIVKTNDILFGGTRPMLKRYCIVPFEYNEQVCSTGYCVLRINNKIALTNYVYHCLGTSAFNCYVEANQQGASYPAIGDAVLKRFEIPVPSIEDQQRIVAILDRLDALCNDITTGLPAEIAARRTQYEYYRDKLLSFEEVA